MQNWGNDNSGYQMITLKGDEGLRMLQALQNGECLIGTLNDIFSSREDNQHQSECTTFDHESYSDYNILDLWYEKNASHLTMDMKDKIDKLKEVDANNRTYMEDLGYLLKHVDEQIERSTDKRWISVLGEIHNTLTSVSRNVLISKESKEKIDVIIEEYESLMTLLQETAYEINIIYSHLRDDEASDFLRGRNIINRKFEISTKVAEKLLDSIKSEG